MLACNRLIYRQLHQSPELNIASSNRSNPVGVGWRTVAERGAQKTAILQNPDLNPDPKRILGQGSPKATTENFVISMRYLARPERFERPTLRFVV